MLFSAKIFAANLGGLFVCLKQQRFNLFGIWLKCPMRAGDRCYTSLHYVLMKVRPHLWELGWWMMVGKAELGSLVLGAAREGMGQQVMPVGAVRCTKQPSKAAPAPWACATHCLGFS